MENEEPPVEAPAEAEPAPAAVEEPAPPAEPAAEPAPEEPAPAPAAEAPAEPEPVEPEPAPAPAPEPEPEPTPAPPPPAAEPPAPQAEATPAPAAPEESYHVVATTEDGGATEFSVAAKAGIEAAEAAGLPPPSAGTVLSSRSGFSMHSSLEGKTFKTKTGRLLSATDLNASMERLSSRGSVMSFGSNFGDLAAMLSPPASARRVLTKDDVSSLVDRLYTIKKVEDLSGTKPRPMKIVFGEGGKEEFEPIEERGAKAQVEALKALYDKCLENRKKTEDELAARYLKPLGTKGRPPA